MGIEGNKLEMLFIKNSERKKGFGKKLLTYGITHYGVNELVVNEENPTAIKFYEHMGFKTYQRKELDEQNNPYFIYEIGNRKLNKVETIKNVVLIYIT